MRSLVFLLVWLAAGAALAQSTNIGRSGVVTTNGGSVLDSRSLRICLLADMQNVVSSPSDAAIPNAAGDCTTDPTYGCRGDFCTQSPYCTVSWRNTASRFMSNLAYDLTGQWDKLDWTGLVGTDNVLTKPNRPIYHQPCDLILSLGDMTDVPNNTGWGDYVDNSDTELAGLGLTYEHETSKAFWSIIDASGIPYLLNQGNHDPWVWWADLFTTFDIENKSYFYNREPVYGLSYSILVPTSLGKSICVLSLAFSDQHHDVVADADRDTNTYAWATGAVGCGGNYPTIFIGHYAVLSDGTPTNTGAAPAFAYVTGGYYAMPGVTGASELFMGAGGHDYPHSTKSNFTGLFGADADATVYTFLSNWQESSRHNTTIPYGPSEKDSNGAWYTIVELQPDRDRICAFDWSPYWQVPNGGTTNGQSANIGTSAGCQAFDFDTRFPP